MSMQRTVDSLARLVQLRAHDVDRLTGELANRQALRMRYQDNLERMEHLLDTTAAGDSGCPALASNSAHYKSSLCDLIAAHRQDLARHDATIEASRQALTQAALKHECLERALQGKRQVLERQRHRHEQKQQDQLAVQAWCRNHSHSRVHLSSEAQP
ncbi:flagellar FliJ family protein [Dyella jejuensis]|uniref:Flagellar FliJ protein n=1 Tax=Dyella jejuensis TaxID=1432009 RepID=A0ABW8JJR1_9GAMM